MFGDWDFRHDRSFRRFWREKPFQRGDLKYVVLSLLEEKPMYGYEIIQALEGQSHGFYKPSPGVVYPTLQMLEEMGYATSEDRDGRKVYTITEEGRAFLKERGDFAGEVKEHIRRHWNRKDHAAFEDIFAEMAGIGMMLRPRMRNMDEETLKNIRDILSRTRLEIRAILDR